MVLNILKQPNNFRYSGSELHLTVSHLSNMVTSLLQPLSFLAGKTVMNTLFVKKKTSFIWSHINMANSHMLKSQTVESFNPGQLMWPLVWNLEN